MVTNSLSLQKKQWRCQRVKYPACSAPLPHPVALSLTGHQQTRHRCSLTSHKQPWQSALRWLPSVLTRSRETTVSGNVQLYGRRHCPMKQEILTENNNETLRTGIPPTFEDEVCHFNTVHRMWIIYMHEIPRWPSNKCQNVQPEHTVRNSASHNAMCSTWLSIFKQWSYFNDTWLNVYLCIMHTTYKAN